MATTGAKLTVPHVVSGSAVVGQGNAPELWVLYTTDDASVSAPTWNDATPKIRSFSTSRGRATELEDVDAGTASIVLDNRTRTFDPTFNSAIRPMSRWMIKEQFTGETQDLFVGYAESYDNTWPSGMDAECQVSLVDEFKVLALDKLPLMDPPRDSYADLVKSDEPSGYWRFHDHNNLGGDPGPGWTINPGGGGYGTTATEQPIIGESEPALGALSMTGTGNGIVLTDASAMDTQGSAAVTVEFWFKFSANPGSNQMFLSGTEDLTASLRSLYFELLTTGAVRFSANNTTPTLHQVSSGVLSVNTWYHVVGEIGGGNVRIYVNGVSVASTAWTGALPAPYDGTPPFIDWEVAGQTMWLDELAFYPARNLGATRVAAHYAAGASRGFPDDETPGMRIGRVLDVILSRAPRSIQTGSRNVVGSFMRGQDTLSELRYARNAEAVDALLFIARDGTVKFLDAAHRSSSPYNTVQATFDDDGTDLPYADVDFDFSESFLFNEWNVTRKGGTLQTSSSAASIATYLKRPQSLTDVPTTSDGNALAIAAALVVKYKDPLTRILSLTLTTHDPAVSEAVFRRDIGDRIRVFRTPPGGGSRIDQTLFIQRIEISGANDGAPWVIRWGVSPV